MRSTLAGAAFGILILAPSASAQTWRELYDRGEYERAAEILHPLVMEAMLDPSVPFPDTQATEALGILYGNGRGVTQDSILACALFNLAERAASYHLHDDHSVTVRIKERQEEQCSRLSTDDRLEALGLMGCFKYGLTRQVFHPGPEHWLELSRAGYTIQQGDRRKHEDWPGPLACAQQFAVVRYTPIDPPADALRPRHFIEFFYWMSSRANGAITRALFWHLWEVKGIEMETVAVETLLNESGSAWPPRGVPAAFANVSFQMLPDGQVRWRFDGFQFDGIIGPLPLEVASEASEDLEPQPAPGTGRIDVTVTDGYGAAVPEATVKLTGVVAREARANEVGGVSFEDLPDGRYNVVAFVKGLAPSVPRVVDLTGSGVTSMAITLKPCAPSLKITLACGGFDARRLETLATGADFVLHVKIEAQRTYEREESSEHGATDIMTASQGRTVESFKAVSSSVAGPLVEIVQFGGSIDRGTYIDHQGFNRLPPLNVGDEYVLFLKRTESGPLAIHGSEEGAFRIRNGRVEPLGGQDVARAWKGRRAETFLQALRTRG